MLDPARPYVADPLQLLLYALAAFAILGILWCLTEFVVWCRRRYRRHVYAVALEIAQKHPEHLIEALRAFNLLPASAETQLVLEPAAITAELVVVPEPDPEIDPYVVPNNIVSAPRVELERHAADMEAENLGLRLQIVELTHRLETVETNCARKDRTRAMYLRRLRHVDEKLVVGSDPWAAMHPALARRLVPV